MRVKGGGERVAIHSMLAGLKAGHRVSLVSEDFDIQDFEDFFGCSGLFARVDLIKYPAFEPLIGKGLRLYQRLVYHQSHLRKAFSTRRDFDLLLGTQDIGYVPSVNVPVVQYCYFPEYFSHLEANPSSPLWRLYYWPASRFYKNRVGRVSRLLATSDYTRGFVRLRWGRDSETLYPPCPTELYSSLKRPREDLIITIGRVVPEKRMHLFVEMARRLPKYQFVVIGSIEGESPYFKSLKREAPTNVSFVLSPLRKVRDILASSKVYVHCAQGEHFGITIVEAMAAGCVPVVHDSGGPTEIVSNDVGFRWREVEEAINQISRLLQDDTLRERLSAAAAVHASNYSPESFESGLARVFKEYAH